MPPLSAAQGDGEVQGAAQDTEDPGVAGGRLPEIGARAVPPAARLVRPLARTPSRSRGVKPIRTAATLPATR
ncbi:MAG: hypothetical protein MZU91_11455 [Desulfosudis oleivorans]|nr:hypothetical protein [Desulfosudis oleivorans]